MGQAGAGNRDGRVNNKARRGGRISGESRRVAGTEPGVLPPRSTATTLTDLWSRLLATNVLTESAGVLEFATLGVAVWIFHIRLLWTRCQWICQ